MLLPRIISIGPGGFLRQQPELEVERLRGTVVASKPMTLSSKPVTLEGMRGDCMEIEVELALGGAAGAGIELRLPSVDTPAAAISVAKDGVLSAGRARTLLGQSELCRLRIFVDKSVFEVYANAGHSSMYGNLSGAPGQLQAVASAQGDGACIISARTWPLEAATFSLEHFRA